MLIINLANYCCNATVGPVYLQLKIITLCRMLSRNIDFMVYNSSMPVFSTNIVLAITNEQSTLFVMATDTSRDFISLWGLIKMAAIGRHLQMFSLDQNVF